MATASTWTNVFQDQVKYHYSRVDNMSEAVRWAVDEVDYYFTMDRSIFKKYWSTSLVFMSRTGVEPR